MLIFHCGDIHLDAPFAALSRDKAQIRKNEVRSSFASIISAALEKKADVMLIAGDLFDSPTPSKSAIDFVTTQLNRLSPMPVFISAGNHDYLTYGTYCGCVELGEHVHVFKDALENVRLDTLKLNIYGASFTSAESNCLIENFKAENADGINILCIHADITAQSRYNPVSLPQLTECGINYAALGHLHTSSLQKVNGMLIAYCGTPNPHGFDEAGAKGYIEVRIDGNAMDAAFFEIPSRRYIVTEMDVSPFCDNDSLINALSNIINSRDLYKIVFAGTLRNGFEISVPYILSRLDYAFFVKAEDKTRIEIDVEALLAEETLRGTFARALKEDIQDNDTLFYEALRIGLDALAGRETF
ncbi:MAG: DNA repair exonuclease [Clostridia bacterium]|nr:DNA repair exonuclease [Clostridia bacterium]